MKAIIPAAGLGTRLRPLTFTRPKPVLPVAGQPIIRHAINTLCEAGITDIGVVVSDITREEIQHAIAGMPAVRITLINQHEQLGLGHAVLTARQWVGTDNFCVYLGDNLFEHGAAPFVRRFQEDGADALIALVEVENPRAFGVAELSGERITRLVEKPKNPPSNLAVAGLYCFSPAIFEVLEGMPPSARGEYEITDGIQALIERGAAVVGQRVEGWWKDTGRPEDLLDANRLLLERIEPDVQGTVEDSQITGRVIVPASSSVVRSKIVGPVLLGENVHVEDAYIGPFTSVGADCVVRQAEIEYSALDAGALVEKVDIRLQDCLIGVKAQVCGGQRRPRALKLTISDASVVELA
ncbi:glucose-1-phosphate thymidylyltransferase [Deinococcus navajonensis]|uniref:Glucose-1-phosphate thymidylyltransferase n=1 Tax=Deinococcus navajonensis TaxID=309884 RepID=A0ABV8XL34_9DEIO